MPLVGVQCKRAMAMASLGFRPIDAIAFFVFSHIFIGKGAFTMETVSDYFGCLVFDERVMKAKLGSNVYRSLHKTIQRGTKLDPSVADAVAAAMKDWAIANGATHFTTGSSPLPALPQKSTTASLPRLRMVASLWTFPARS